MNTFIMSFLHDNKKNRILKITLFPLTFASLVHPLKM